MKIAKYTVLVLAMALIAYNSLYFKDLNEVKAALSAKAFNPAQYADEFWNKKLTPGLVNAVDLASLFPMLSSDPDQAFKKYSHALGIGNLRYFLVSGSGSIESVNQDDVFVLLQTGGENHSITIATEFIFGNAVRDAAGLIDINDFNNTMDFNNVSAEINKIIRAKVLPAFVQKARKGDKVSFTGAIELNREHINLTHLEIVPVQLNIQ